MPFAEILDCHLIKPQTYETHNTHYNRLENQDLFTKPSSGENQCVCTHYLDWI